jgi:hypothetical protein
VQLRQIRGVVVELVKHVLDGGLGCGLGHDDELPGLVQQAVSQALNGLEVLIVSTLLLCCIVERRHAVHQSKAAALRHRPFKLCQFRVVVSQLIDYGTAQIAAERPL